MTTYIVCFIKACFCFVREKKKKKKGKGEVDVDQIILKKVKACFCFVRVKRRKGKGKEVSYLYVIKLMILSQVITMIKICCTSGWCVWLKCSNSTWTSYDPSLKTLTKQNSSINLPHFFTRKKQSKNCPIPQKLSKPAILTRKMNIETNLKQITPENIWLATKFKL